MLPTATRLVKKLQDAGHRAYWVGGCVRDKLLGLDPVDIDIATSASPSEIEDLFEKSFPIGKKFGVILIKENGHYFEVATFRSDGSYSDGRRPDAVMFATPEEDAERRDFTINAIFWDPITEEFFDPVDGKSDLRRGLLRLVGDPDTRVNEDFLRLLRGVRFRSRFNLTYHADTAAAIERHASLVVDVAGERLRDELSKILVHDSRAAGLTDLEYFGLLEKILPEVAALRHVPQSAPFHMEGDALTHTARALGTLVDPSPDLAWAVLLHDTGKAAAIQYDDERIRFPKHDEHSGTIARKICHRLKFSKKSTDRIVWLVTHHHLFDGWDRMRLVTKLEYFDHPDFEKLLALHRADVHGCLPDDPATRERDEQHLERLENDLRYARQEQLLPSHHDELLTGVDIAEITGITPGPKIGKLKKLLREQQLEGQVKSREDAVEWLRKL